MLVLAVLAYAWAVSAATYVFWYNAITKNYSLTDCNPGPCLDAGDTVFERMIATGTVAQHSGTSEPSIVFGSGLDDQQGRCGFFWSWDLDNCTGSVSAAHIRAEYRDGWCGSALVNSGPINIRCGVVNFQGNLDTWGGPEFVPETADWQDFLNPLSSSMGFDFITPTLQAEEVIAYTAEAGRPTEFDGSVLDGKFFEVDVADQVNWILENSGTYAIVLLVPPNEDNTGKVNSYSDESGAGALGSCPSDAPWTTDGNTVHLKLVSDNLNIEESPYFNVRTGLSLNNSPNPFTQTTTITYNTGNYGDGVLRIYSPAGQMVQAQEVNSAGRISWNSRDLAMGIYMIRLTAGNKVLSRRMILLK
jgi:hypothetical protein